MLESAKMALTRTVLLRSLNSCYLLEARPLDAGRVARLRFLRRWPAVLTPALRIPVLTPETFLDATQAVVEDELAHRCEPGVTVRDFGRDRRGTLRDVRLAMRRKSEGVVR